LPLGHDLDAKGCKQSADLPQLAGIAASED
jgi:hypothetical protein